MNQPSIHIIDSPTGLLITGWGFSTCANLDPPIPIPRGQTERILMDLCLHIRSGINPSKILEHLSYHQSTTTIDSQCPCCKLEGRIMAASGRKRPDTSISHRAAHGGTVQVRHIRSGISGAQLKAYEEAYAKRTTPHSNVTKIVKQRIEDLI
jgi:hypothetical protein